MEINEAYRILGAARSDDENTIKKKYKRLPGLGGPMEQQNAQPQQAQQIQQNRPKKKKRK